MYKNTGMPQTLKFDLKSSVDTMITSAETAISDAKEQSQPKTDAVTAALETLTDECVDSFE